jgi:hypothetical protein
MLPTMEEFLERNNMIERINDLRIHISALRAATSEKLIEHANGFRLSNARMLGDLEGDIEAY